METLDDKDIALLHFKQIYPINTIISKYLNKAEKTMIIEQNYSGHFAKLVKLETGKDFDLKILKYSGYCFSVEEIINKLKKSLEE